MIKVAFNFKFQGAEIVKLFSQGTDDSINLRYESLITVDYKYEEMQFCFLGCEVMAERRWLLNSDIYWNSFIRRPKVSVCVSHYFIFNTARLVIPIYLESAIIRLSCLKFWQSSVSWEKNSIFQSLAIWSIKRLWPQNLQNKVTLSQSFNTMPERQESDYWSRETASMFRFSAETFESDFSMDDYAKDGGPEVV